MALFTLSMETSCLGRESPKLLLFLFSKKLCLTTLNVSAVCLALMRSYSCQKDKINGRGGDTCQVESSLLGISMNEKIAYEKAQVLPLPRQHQINPKNLCNDPNFAFRNSLPFLLAAERVIDTILIYREGIESAYIGPLICEMVALTPP